MPRAESSTVLFAYTIARAEISVKVPCPPELRDRKDRTGN